WTQGERGSVVVTVLEKDSFLVSYALEDVVRWNWKACACGETHRRLFYEGRLRDVVRVGQREVLPIDVALVLYEFPEASTPSAEYQIVRTAESMDALHVRLEHAGGVDETALRTKLAERFRERLGVTTRLEVVGSGTLPRFAYKAARVDEAGPHWPRGWGRAGDRGWRRFPQRGGWPGRSCGDARGP